MEETRGRHWEPAGLVNRGEGPPVFPGAASAQPPPRPVCGRPKSLPRARRPGWSSGQSGPSSPQRSRASRRAGAGGGRLPRGPAHARASLRALRLGRRAPSGRPRPLAGRPGSRTPGHQKTRVWSSSLDAGEARDSRTVCSRRLNDKTESVPSSIHCRSARAPHPDVVRIKPLLNQTLAQGWEPPCPARPLAGGRESAPLPSAGGCRSGPRRAASTRSRCGREQGRRLPEDLLEAGRQAWSALKTPSGNAATGARTPRGTLSHQPRVLPRLLARPACEHALRAHRVRHSYRMNFIGDHWQSRKKICLTGYRKKKFPPPFL